MVFSLIQQNSALQRDPTKSLIIVESLLITLCSVYEKKDTRSSWLENYIETHGLIGNMCIVNTIH